MKIELKEINKEVVERLLDGLRTVDQDKIIRKGVNDALHLITVKGILNLRDRYKGYQTGNLEKSLIVRIKRTKIGGLAGFVDKAWYAYLVDRGSGKDRTLKSGANRGTMPGNRFWRDAIESEGDAAQEVLMRSVTKALLKIEERSAK